MNESEVRDMATGMTTEPASSGENSERPMGMAKRHSVEQKFLDYYGLNEQPFGVTPDLRFLYLGSKHRQALDVLNYGTQLDRGFVTVTAEAGMGKTSLLYHYLEGLRDTARTVFLFQTDGDSTELMRYLLADLGLDGKGMDLPEMRAVLSQVLLGEMQAGRRFILVIDEAQNLDEKVLESVRLLSNFETPWMKLMHIVLAGQPQLAERLAKPSMKQFRQRVSFAIRIEPFTREEVDLYVDHRLWVAGYKGAPLFSVGARALLAEHSEGIPRNINNLCFCAMSYAWATQRKTIDRDMMGEVLSDLDEPPQMEKEKTAAPQLQEEPKPSVTQFHPPVGLALAPPPAPRGWLSKIAIFCIVGVVLGWIGLQPNVEKWIGSSFNGISTGVRSFLDPSSTPPDDPTSTVDSHKNSSTSLEFGGASDTQAGSRPEQGGANSSSSGGGHN